MDGYKSRVVVVNVYNFSPKDDVHNLTKNVQHHRTTPTNIQFNTIKQYILSYAFLFYNITCLAYPCVSERPS